MVTALILAVGALWLLIGAWRRRGHQPYVVTDWHTATRRRMLIEYQRRQGPR
jgi:hypothetical protein